MYTGIVKFYNPAKGFGFIAREAGGQDVFIHASELKRAGLINLDQGQKVVFDIGAGRIPGRTAAVDLRIV